MNVRKSFLIPLCLLVIIVVGICFLSAFQVSADSNQSPNYKYFKSIVIQEGDTLWSIADTYISEEYKGIEEYVEELKSMNGLGSDTIHAGQNLMVAYYSEELK